MQLEKSLYKGNKDRAQPKRNRLNKKKSEAPDGVLEYESEVVQSQRRILRLRAKLSNGAVGGTGHWVLAQDCQLR